MFSLRRQWQRFQLGRELLLEYEREERERIEWPEIMRRMEIASRVYSGTRTDAGQRWAEAVRARMEQYQSDA